MIITQIEDAMIARVKAVNSVANFGGLLKTVERYSGDFADENLDRLVTSAPCVLISHTNSRVVQSTSTGEQWYGEFTILCAATSRRVQEMASRVGGAAAIELGARQIAELVRDIIAGQQLGLQISSLDPLGMEEVYSGQAGGAGGQNFLSVTGLTFACKYSTTRSTVADPQGTRLAAIVAKFMAVVGANAPIDDPDNSTVTVTLPGATS